MVRAPCSRTALPFEEIAVQNVVFPNKILPYLLVAPQIILTVVFFFWPASQALYQSLQREDPFGMKSGFVGLANFWQVLGDPSYLHSLQVTVVFSVATAALSMIAAIALATAADKVVRGKTLYRTLLIWPYAVAPAVAGMLWLFMFNPAIGYVRIPASSQWVCLGSVAKRRPGDFACRRCRGLETNQLQLPVLCRGLAGHSQILA